MSRDRLAAMRVRPLLLPCPAPARAHADGPRAPAPSPSPRLAPPRPQKSGGPARPRGLTIHPSASSPSLACPRVFVRNPRPLVLARRYRPRDSRASPRRTPTTRCRASSSKGPFAARPPPRFPRPTRRPLLGLTLPSRASSTSIATASPPTVSRRTASSSSSRLTAARTAASSSSRAPAARTRCSRRAAARSTSGRRSVPCLSSRSADELVDEDAVGSFGAGLSRRTSELTGSVVAGPLARLPARPRQIGDIRAQLGTLRQSITQIKVGPVAFLSEERVFAGCSER